MTNPITRRIDRWFASRAVALRSAGYVHGTTEANLNQHGFTATDPIVASCRECGAAVADPALHRTRCRTRVHHEPTHGSGICPRCGVSVASDPDGWVGSTPANCTPVSEAKK